jgi:hypothetical protein
MEGCENRVSCRDLYKKLHILPLTSQCLLSLLMFVDQHKDLFITSIQSHNLETSQSNNLYIPQANLSIYQKGAYYSGIKIFNKLPSNIKNVNGDVAKFKMTLKKFLYTNSFDTLEEYFDQSWYQLRLLCIFVNLYILFIVDLFYYACFVIMMSFSFVLSILFSVT